MMQKLGAKHTIDMARFVDRDEIDSRDSEKTYSSFRRMVIGSPKQETPSTDSGVVRPCRTSSYR